MKTTIRDVISLFPPYYQSFILSHNFVHNDIDVVHQHLNAYNAPNNIDRTRSKDAKELRDMTDILVNHESLFLGCGNKLL